MLDADLLLDAGRDLLQRQRQADLKIVAARRTATPATATAEQVLERTVAAEVAHERAQRVGQVEALEAAAIRRATATAASRGGMAELIVARTLLRIAQHLVRLGGLLELGLGLGIPGVAIGMPLHGHFAVGLLDVVLARALPDAEHFVVVALGHQGSIRATTTRAARSARSPRR